jgi:hypothetical protein
MHCMYYTDKENNVAEAKKDIETLFAIDSCLDDSVLEEFNDFYADFPSLVGTYKLLGKIGEGPDIALAELLCDTMERCIELNWNIYRHIQLCVQGC